MTERHDACREYLDSYRELLMESERLSSGARSLWEAATGVTSHLTGMPVSHDAERDVKTLLAEASEAAERHLAEALRKRAEIETFIGTIPGGMNRMILSYRYINLMTWPQVMAAMENAGIPYSERNIFNLHGRALEAAREKWNELHRKGEDHACL